jgi:hypothetical protein
MRLVQSALVAALMIAATSASHAQSSSSYPWCYIDQTTSGATYCAFTTLAQCRENAGNIGGTCIQNPDYHGAPSQPARRSPRR